MKMSKEAALAILGDLEILIEDKIISHNRWSVVHRLVVRLDGKIYMTTYSVGATEYQDETPWQDETEVEFVEVERKEKVVYVYEYVEKKI